MSVSDKDKLEYGINSLLYPEKYPNFLLPNQTYAASMQICRTFDVQVDDSVFDFTYNVNYMSDCGDDFFYFNDKQYIFECVDKVIERYVVVSMSVQVVAYNQVNGYFWGASSEDKVIRPKSTWVSTMVPIKDGMRMVYTPDEWEYKNINECGKKTYFSIFTEHNVSGLFEIKITKNINFVPYDTELFNVRMNNEIKDIKLLKI